MLNNLIVFRCENLISSFFFTVTEFGKWIQPLGWIPSVRNGKAPIFPRSRHAVYHLVPGLPFAECFL